MTTTNEKTTRHAPPLTERQERTGRAASAGARRVMQDDSFDTDALDSARPAAAPKAGAISLTPEKMGQLLDELEKLEEIPEGERTIEQHDRQIEIAKQLAAAGLAHEEVGTRWYKPEEGGVFTARLLGYEIHPDEINGENATQRAYRIMRGGREELIGESWGLRALIQYPEGSRVVIASLGKFDLGKGRSVHKFKISPPPPGAKSVLPLLYDCTAAE